MEEVKASHAIMDESVNFSTSSTLATNQFTHSQTSLFQDEKNRTFIDYNDFSKINQVDTDVDPQTPNNFSSMMVCTSCWSGKNDSKKKLSKKDKKEKKIKKL